MQPVIQRTAILLRELVTDARLARRLRAMTGGEPFSIHIAEHPEPLPEGQSLAGHPIVQGGMVLGQVHGQAGAALVAEELAALAELLAGQESLRHRLQDMQDEVTRFYELSAKAAGCNSPAEVCNLVVEEARRLFKADDICISLRLHESDEGSAGFCAAQGVSTGQEPGENTLSSMMSELMNVQGKVIGVISVASTSPGAFTRADMQLLKALAAQAAAPIESARHQHRLKGILATIDRLNRFEDLDTILDAILLESRKLVNADAGTIYLLEDDRLRFSYVHNDTLFRQDEANAEIYRSYSLPIDESSIVGYAALTGNVVRIDDAYSLPPDAPYTFNKSFDTQRGYRTTSILALPLHTHHGALVGVMQLINARNRQGQVTPFPRDLLTYLPLYANNAAAALERAMMTRERVLRMMKLAELRDPHETGPHVQRVGAYSTEIYMQWARNNRVEAQTVKATRDLLRLAAMLHDVGKVGISDAILKKPGKLTDEEFAIMKWHPVHGARLFLGATPELDRMCRDICLGHHERWDGRGYPGRIAANADPSAGLGQGLSGEEIPLAARIVALADVYDALSSRRCYKDAWPHDRVLATIAEERGRQFDPALVDAFFQIIPLFEAIRERYQEAQAEG